MSDDDETCQTCGDEIDDYNTCDSCDYLCSDCCGCGDEDDDES